MAAEPDARPDVDDLVEQVKAAVNASPADCVTLADSVLATIRAAGEEHAEMRTLFYVGFAHHLLSQDAEALSAMERALDITQRLGDRAWEGTVMGGLGPVHGGFGDNATAIEFLEHSLEIRRELGDARGIAASLHNLGVRFGEMGLFPERARELLSEAHTIFAELGNDEGRAASLIHLATLDVARSEQEPGTPEARVAAAAALESIGRAAEIARSMPGNLRLLSEILLVRARALVAAGDLDAADVAIDEAMAPGDQVDTSHYRLELSCVRGRMLRLRGDFDAAVAELERGLAAATKVQRAFEQVALLTELVAAHEARGSFADALATHRRLMDATLRQREDAAERRARMINARLDVERAQMSAEMERLRATQLETANRELEHDALHDALTGVLNRRGFDARIEELSSAPEGPFTLVVGDLDQFKAVNDTFSHPIGDEVLRQTARLMSAAVRGTDVVARTGGEEFAVLVQAVNDHEIAALCERIRRMIADHDWDTLVPGLSATMSIGAADRLPGEPADSLVARADAALYEAKAAGRNTVRVAGTGLPHTGAHAALSGGAEG